MSFVPLPTGAAGAMPLSGRALVWLFVLWQPVSIIPAIAISKRKKIFFMILVLHKPCHAIDGTDGAG
jgi:hypothetical protein